MMQFNMYHHYTVDEHTIQCISTLAQIERGELIEELPVATRILEEGVNRKVLYLALLLHDIGKGRRRGSLGRSAPASPARSAPRLGLKPRGLRHRRMAGALSPADVRHGAETRHRRSAHGARFRQGGADAEAAGSADRADRLRHPRRRARVWNNWKAALLRASTARPARAGERAGGRSTASARERRGQGRAARGPVRLGRGEAQGRDRAPLPPYWQGLHVPTHVVFAAPAARARQTTRSGST